MLGIFKVRDDNKNLIKCTLIGSLCITLAYAILVIDPLQRVIDNQLSIHPHSFLLFLFKTPPVDVYIRVTIFNFTNTDRFLAGIDKKLSVQDVGPFVYQEVLEHHNITFNANGTMSYVPVRTQKFIPELSIGNLSDFNVVVPNIPLLGVSAQASKWSVFAALSVSTLAKTMNLQPFLNLTVEEFLWGYDDPLLKLGSTIIPTVYDIKTFGLLERMFDDKENLVVMNLPGSSDPKKTADETIAVRDYSIDKWNGKVGFDHWNYNEASNESNVPCNTLRGAYDGTLFPKQFRNDFQVYRRQFCRHLPIKHTHSERVDQMDIEWFRFDENAFLNNASDPNTKCFCENGMCLKRGLGDLSPCYYNIPVAVSMPHFLDSDPTIVDRLEGLKPNAEDHGSVLGIQPQFGVPMTVNMRLQINLLIEETRFNAAISPLNGVPLPLLWLEIRVDKIPRWLEILHHIVFNIAPYAQQGLVYFLFIFGASAILLILVRLTFWRNRNSNNNGIMSPIPTTTSTTAMPETERIIRNNLIKYTAISLFPPRHEDKQEGQRLN